MAQFVKEELSFPTTVPQFSKNSLRYLDSILHYGAAKCAYVVIVLVMYLYL